MNKRPHHLWFSLYPKGLNSTAKPGAQTTSLDVAEKSIVFLKPDCSF